MIDLPKARAAILVPGEIAMVLDAKATHFLGACPNVGNRIDVEVIHHIACVVVDFDPLVADLADDGGARGPRAGFAAVLFDDDRHTVVACHRAELLESLDPEFAVAAPGVRARSSEKRE